MATKKDTFSYKGWLISDSFIKRSFASLGYHVMGIILIWIGILAIGLVIGVLGLIFGKMF